jgi:L,D-transpeptidase catalytic domain
MKRVALIAIGIALLSFCSSEKAAARPRAAVAEQRVSAGVPGVPILFPWSTSSAARSTSRAQLAEHLARQSRGLSQQVAALAIDASACAARAGLSPRSRYLAIIDFSHPSTKQRFWLFDVVSEQLLEQDHVAHGRNSGELYATAFSNLPGSLQSSIGLFYTDEPYVGQHGESLRLRGLEPGFNDQAYDRAIVIHGADYVSNEFISRHNRLGRSFGCPALPLRTVPRTIQTLQNGAYVFAYYPSTSYLSSSQFLNCSAARKKA